MITKRKPILNKISLDGLEPESPELALMSFLKAWQEKDIKRMLGFSQSSQISSKMEAEYYILIDKMPLFVARLANVKIKKSPAFISIMVFVQWQKAPKIYEKDFYYFNVIREDKQGNPDEKGVWGVNIYSMRKVL